MSQLGLGMTTEETRHPLRRPGRRGGGVAVAVAAVAVVIVLGLLLVSVVRWFATPPDYTGNGHGQVLVQIRTGDSLSQVGDRLQQADVVRSASLFADVAGADPSGSDIQPGTYRLRLEMSATAALALLIDPSSRLASRVLIPEGLRADQTV